MVDYRIEERHGSDVRCHLCGEPCYILWVDKVHHGNVCMFGCEVVTDCKYAMDHAAQRAEIVKAGGLLKWAEAQEKAKGR